jgi:hypothetical protein
MLYKTCNDCRVHARRNSRAAIDERMSAAAANEDDDNNNVAEDEDTYANTTMRAAIHEGRRLASIQRRRDAMRRLNISDTIISSSGSRI